MIREKETPDLQTPMMRQYLSVKEKYAKEIVLFRMGDFYETFFDDARTASEVLGIALTSRSKEKDAVPMAGVPVRAADGYIARLLKAGKRVAICEQMEDPREAVGLVEREVVRVISPGTVTDEKLIGEKWNNYIAAVAEAKDAWGLAWLDVTTGQFFVWETRDPAALQVELSRIAPSECVLPESLEFALEGNPALLRALEGAARTPAADATFERKAAERTLNDHFGTRSLDGFGCADMDCAVRAGGGLLAYVMETQKDALRHLSRMRPYQAASRVPVDRATRRSLELLESSRGERTGTLLESIDFTVTSQGGRLLKDWILAPLVDPEEISARQDAVAEWLGASEEREAMRELLRQVHDIERICTRISYGSANARDLSALEKTLGVLPLVRDLLRARATPRLREAAEAIRCPEELRARLAAAIVDAPPLSIKDGGLIRPGYDPALDELRDVSREGTRWIARFQEEEARRTGISSLKVGFNKVFGYYIEVTNTHREKIPEHYVRKQTLKNCERFLTAELKEHETRVLTAKDRGIALEQEIFLALREEAALLIPDLQNTAALVAEVDVLVGFAETAAKRRYVRPRVTDGTRLWIENGRHPVVEAALTRDVFVPNSIDLDTDRAIMIITGPNMAGKSTYIRQVAILALLAQTGSFIPADDAEIGVVDRVFTRVGASDDLTRGQSTFMVEMFETANILNNATARSLIVLDEVGRGTSTFDGVSLAWAITEYIATHLGARTLFATHYHELTALASTQTVVRNYNIAVKEWNEDIIFLRKVVPGGTDKSYGIHVARLAGIPGEVIDRAREILSNLESQSLDLHDRPVLATRRRSLEVPHGVGKPPPRQLDLFEEANERLLKELKRLDTDRMTPIEALRYLSELRGRII